MHRQSLVRFLLSSLQSSLAAATTIALAVITASPASAASLTPVNLELSLLIDVSSSVDAQEYALQMGGYQKAFTNLASQFGAGGLGDVAINAVLWSGPTEQVQAIGWTLLNDQTSALQFANQIGSIARPLFRNGTTAPGSALNFAVPLFASNSFDGQRWVIDVSGDGKQNNGFTTTITRNRALAAGVTSINGLPILGEDGLQPWYEQNIQGGADSFVVPANGFSDFDRAIEQKLARELGSTGAVPEPTTMLGMALAGGGLAYLKRRQRSA